ncbi:MAG: hypothetical protein QOD07_165 [Frankiaceae bacterium]|nr:hypothetical protein [Frankiaceae bacterium]
MLKVCRRLDVIETRHHLARLGVDGEAETHDEAKRGVVPAGLDLRQVADADASPLGNSHLRKPIPAAQLLQPRAEQAPYALVPFVVRHGRIVRRSPLVTPARYPSINFRENA